MIFQRGPHPSVHKEDGTLKSQVWEIRKFTISYPVSAVQGSQRWSKTHIWKSCTTELGKLPWQGLIDHLQIQMLKSWSPVPQNGTVFEDRAFRGTTTELPKWALIQSQRCPYKKRKFGHTEGTGSGTEKMTL